MSVSASAGKPRFKRARHKVLAEHTIILGCVDISFQPYEGTDKV